MEQLRSATRDRTRSGSLDLPRKHHSLVLSLAVAGALSFWLPDLAIHMKSGANFDARQVWLISILAPAAFLFTYVIARRFAIRKDFKWVGAAMLLGVWLTGGLFMMLAAMASGSGFIGATGAWRVVVVALSVIPIVTYILAAYDGSLFALVAVTLAPLVLCGIRASWSLLTSAPLVKEAAGEKSMPQSRRRAA